MIHTRNPDKVLNQVPTLQICIPPYQAVPQGLGFRASADASPSLSNPQPPSACEALSQSTPLFKAHTHQSLASYPKSAYLGNPKPQTLNLKPQTPNPKPQTLNRKPLRGFPNKAQSLNLKVSFPRRTARSGRTCGSGVSTILVRVLAGLGLEVLGFWV